MKHASWAMILLAVGGLAASEAPAQPPGPPGGGRPGGPGGFGPGTFLAPRVFEDADADKDGRLSPEEAARAAEKLVRDADADKKGSLDATALARAINRKVIPPDAPVGDGPPGGFGPGMMFAPMVIASADADKDGRISPEEAGKAADKFVRDADAGKTGSIDTDVLADAMNRRMGPPGGGPGGPGGPGGMMGADRQVVKDHDKDKNGRLDTDERRDARAAIKKGQPGGGPGGPGGFGGPGGPGGFGGPPGMMGGERIVGKPGPKVDPASVSPHPGAPLYDPGVIRTFFLDFEDKDWEVEMADFYRTDVEVPATLTVDGKKYPGVGVQFRGLSSFMGVQAGSKRSLNLSLDLVDPKQRLLGYKSLNLLNSHEDPTFLHSVLYFDIARNYIPAPKANFVRVVINGESWGLYVNAQQFDKIFLGENYPDSKGTRWKVKGNPGGGGGLDYVGDDVEVYRRRYDIKSGDDEKAWKALVLLCKTLTETPADQLEEALKPMLDVEGALRFLALDNVLINGDGYWIRASDYSIYRDGKGIFHVIPHDANETFQPPMGPGMGGPPGMGRGRPGGGGPGGGPGGPGGGGPGGPGGGGGFAGGGSGTGGGGGFAGPGGAQGGPGGGPGAGGGGPRPAGVELDPLIGLDDVRKPLRSKLLAVPALRERYLKIVAEIADRWLDWERLGPIVGKYRDLIGPEVAADTRKLSSTEAFQRSAADAPPPPPAGLGQLRRVSGLREFADLRRKYLLELPAIRQLKP